MNGRKSLLDQAVYPGERMALVLSLGVLGLLGYATFLIRPSLVLFTVVGSLVYIRSRQGHLLGNSVLVTDSSYARLSKLVDQSCRVLGIKRPRVHVIQDPYLNAYAMGFAKPFTIVVHSALFENFTDTELLFVIGHELAHIKRKHTVWLSLIAPFGRTLPVFDLIFNYWQRRCEFTCDRMGLLVCQDLSSAIQAMIKVGSGLHVLEHTDFGEFAKQATQAKGNILDSWPEMLNAHPYITNRISRLTEFFNTIRPADREAAANKDSRIILCQNEQCKAKLRIPFSTKNFIVTCPKCKESFRVTPEY